MNIPGIFKAALFFTVFTPGIAIAQQSVDITNLDFGIVTVTDNNSQRQIAFLPNGSYNVDGQLYMLRNPVFAHVTVQGYPPNMFLNVTFPSSATLTGGTGQLTVNNFFTIPPSFPTEASPNPATALRTDGAGNATFDIGGVLSTNAMTDYSDARFSVQVDVGVQEGDPVN